MPVNKIDITFDNVQLPAIKAAFVTANSNFPFAQNLTIQERTALPNIENERYPYVQRTIEVHAPNNPALVNGFAGTTAEATRDWTVVKQFDELIPVVRAYLEKLQDTRQIAASEAY